MPGPFVNDYLGIPGLHDDPFEIIRHGQEKGDGKYVEPPSLLVEKQRAKHQCVQVKQSDMIKINNRKK